MPFAWFAPPEAWCAPSFLYSYDVLNCFPFLSFTICVVVLVSRCVSFSLGVAHVGLAWLCFFTVHAMCLVRVSRSMVFPSFSVLLLCAELLLVSAVYHVCCFVC